MAFPLHIASRLGQVDEVKRLLQCGEEVNERDLDGNTPIYKATDYNHVEVVKCLLDADADTSLPNSDGNTPLYKASWKNHVSIVQVLIKAKANVNSQNKSGDTPLHTASLNFGVDVVKCLLSAGADPNIKNKYGNTPLYTASGNNHATMMKYLVRAGADINHQNKKGNTALYTAAGFNCVDTLKYLIQTGADLNIQNENGNTALYMAAWNNNTEVIRCLVLAGCLINVRNKDGYTAVNAACHQKYSESVRCLLRAGADISLKDKEGKPIIMEMIEYFGLYETLMLLSESTYMNDPQRTSNLNLCICEKPDGTTETLNLLEDDVNRRFPLPIEDGCHVSVVIHGIEHVPKQVNTFLENHTIHTLIISKSDITDMDTVRVSHALGISRALSFDPTAIMSWLLPTVKTISCIGVDIPVPWYLNFPGSLHSLNIRNCSLRAKAHDSKLSSGSKNTSDSLTPEKYIHVCCEGLVMLCLRNNGLVKLQEDLGLISGLSEIDVRDNCIQRIPPSISCATNCTDIKIQGNPVANIPCDIIGEGRVSIMSYLKEFLSKSRVINDSVKMVIAGHEGAGKTSLLSALNDHSSPVDKTDGIDISEIHLRDSGNKLIVFDFAGDVDFLESHSLFLTDDTIYVVVFDLSKFALGEVSRSNICMHQLGRVVLWLRTINTSAPNSRVILVGTHADAPMLATTVLNHIWQQFADIFNKAHVSHRQSHRMNILTDCIMCSYTHNPQRQSSFNGLAGYVECEARGETVPQQEKDDASSNGDNLFCFPHIVGYYEVSSTMAFPAKVLTRKNRSIIQLKAAIERVASEMLSVQSEIPQTWHTLQNTLKARQMINPSRPILTYSEYQTIAFGIGIRTAESLHHVTSFLGSRGCIVYIKPSHQKEAKSIVILDPQWLANILRMLISFSSTFIDDFGVLNVEDLHNAWGHIDKQHHHPLLSLLTASRICFPFDSITRECGMNFTKLIFPCKLPIGEPCLDDWHAYPYPGDCQLSYLYQFDFLPPVFFCDTIVGVNKAISFIDDPILYRNNMVFRTEGVRLSCNRCFGQRSGNSLHGIRLQLLYQSSSILLTVRGKNACCVILSIDAIIREISSRPSYSGVIMKSSPACPLCVVKRHDPPGRIQSTESNVAYVCSLYKGHMFDSWDELIHCHGIQRHDISTLLTLKDDFEYPRLFLILPINTGGMSTTEIIKNSAFSHFQDGYAVHLLCEFAGSPHFINSLGYRIYNVKEFVKVYGPHICKVLILLQKVVGLSTSVAPIDCVPVGKTVLTSSTMTLGRAKNLLTNYLHDFEAECPEISKTVKRPFEENINEVLRCKHTTKRKEFVRFLGKVDENRRFGDLFPILQGESVHWLCEEHANISK
ncbi:uncharacterized protein LOC102800687 [Saccoglossus kowalevskii]|uniref:Uncharacterized protein LOC102800687 n=1 Tax=Saccoglossus kowalevskii TaxID=10224 RepID=A0ABM0M0G7_SACKO|nr:PREDICTED: uncharacterized protein LOC102800687 [Saccoglossus kowalevskii]